MRFVVRVVFLLAVLAGMAQAQQHRDVAQELRSRFDAARQALAASFQARIDRILDDQAVAFAQLGRQEERELRKLEQILRQRQAARRAVQAKAPKPKPRPVQAPEKQAPNEAADALRHIPDAAKK